MYHQGCLFISPSYFVLQKTWSTIADPSPTYQVPTMRPEVAEAGAYVIPIVWATLPFPVVVSKAQTSGGRREKTSLPLPTTRIPNSLLLSTIFKRAVKINWAFEKPNRSGFWATISPANGARLTMPKDRLDGCLPITWHRLIPLVSRQWHVDCELGFDRPTKEAATCWPIGLLIAKLPYWSSSVESYLQTAIAHTSYKTFKVQRRMLNQASHHTIYLHLQKSTPGTTVQLVEMPPSICWVPVSMGAF